MPSKKKKYNARFPAGRIKKIMQTDDEVGKVAQAVPVIISRTLELFVESLLVKSMEITQARSAKTLTPSHMKQCILSESRFDFLKDLVKNIPDPSTQEDNENNAREELCTTPAATSSSGHHIGRSKSPPRQYGNASTSTSTSACFSRTPVIQFVPKASTDAELHQQSEDSAASRFQFEYAPGSSDLPVPPLVPIQSPPKHGANNGTANTEGNLYIDEDYDN